MISTKARVYYNEQLAGYLEKSEEGYSFFYDDDYFENEDSPAISLAFPKQQKEFRSEYLFPFFFGILAEGEQKEIQCKKLKIDENDHFTRLLKTANQNTIGAVTVREDEL